MLIVEDLTQAPSSLRDPILAIGVFDGLHLGHQMILRGLVERAHARGGSAAVLTFTPHPQKVIRPADAPRLLQTQKQKEEMLDRLGLDLMIRLPFTRRLSLLTPEEFVSEIILRQRVKEIHVGSNFRFGHRRQGDFAALRELGFRYGFEVHEVESVCFRGCRVSSTRVRRLLTEGNVSLARRLLGRPYQIRGTVVRGAGRGKTIGFPTANLQLENELIPAVGVYVTRSLVNGGWTASVTNIGFRPTVDLRQPSGPVVESHLLDYHGDLYGKSMSVEFCRGIRPEMKFADLEELKKQIRLDVKGARRYARRLAARGLSWR